MPLSHTTYIIKTPCYEAYIQDGQIVIKILDIDSTTDASEDRLIQTGQHVEEDGSVNYYEEADLELVRQWRVKLGKLAAEQIVKPAVVAQGKQCDLNHIHNLGATIANTRSGVYGNKHTVLLHLPKGYKLFAHRKGDRHIPRVDSYLLGKLLYTKDGKR